VYALDQLEAEYAKARADAAFQAELDDLLANYVGRPSPLYHAKRLSEKIGGAQIWLKREDLNHTGAHKINNTLGQALLTLRMKKTRVIAETGAGQHGVATATACAHFGLPCVVYMGEEDIRRQAPNVFAMRLLGAEVRPVTSGSRTLRDAINEAMRDWMSSVADTHYILGSVVGPHPFPQIVRDFQSVIGRETIEHAAAARTTAESVRRAWAEAERGGDVFPWSSKGSSSWASGRRPRCRPAIRRRSLGFARRAARQLQRDAGRGRATSPVHSVSAGLDYPGVGPEHSYWKTRGRQYGLDEEGWAFDAGVERGSLPAPAAAIAKAMELAKGRPKTDMIVACLSGRGDRTRAKRARA
jgi:tryptophan synthase beta chain